MDAEVGRQFQRILQKQGMQFRLSRRSPRSSVTDKGATLTVEPAAGGAAETIEADVVLVAIGRVPYTEGLGLDACRRADGPQGPHPHRRALFSTNVTGIYAIGDVIAGPDARPQGGGRGRRGGGDHRGPRRPRELRRHPERGLHLPGGRLRRQDRGGAEGRRASPTRSASSRSPPTAAPRSTTPPTAS